jgi:predicted house-cleaning noncanonical NTP pyrophosphatase (MazG superfamily)
MKLKVRDYPDLVRDSQSKAIINTNRSAMVQHIEKRETKVSIQSLQEEMNVIKDEFQEIKELLRQIASRNH